MLSSIRGLFPLDANSTLQPPLQQVVTNLKCLQIRANVLWGRPRSQLVQTPRLQPAWCFRKKGFITLTVPHLRILLTAFLSHCPCFSVFKKSSICVCARWDSPEPKWEPLGGPGISGSGSLFFFLQTMPGPTGTIERGPWTQQNKSLVSWDCKHLPHRLIERRAGEMLFGHFSRQSLNQNKKMNFKSSKIKPVWEIQYLTSLPVFLKIHNSYRTQSGGVQPRLNYLSPLLQTETRRNIFLTWRK